MKNNVQLHILTEMQINEVNMVSPTSSVFCLDKKHHSPVSSNQIPTSYLAKENFPQVPFPCDLLADFDRCYLLIVYKTSWFSPPLLLPF